MSSTISTARLLIALIMNVLITIAEIIGGILSGSLALLSDAFHNFSDCISIIISYIALRLSKLPRTSRFTFGLKRAEILAAAINAGTLIVICFYLFKEAYARFLSPQPISTGLMIVVAGVGLVANVIGALLLKSHSHDNMNIRSTYLHLMGDTISSVAVIIGGICIYFFRVYWIDPLLTVLISVYILKESVVIAKDAVNVLMMGSPQTVSIETIRKELEGIPGVKNIHHVHIWRLDEHSIHFEAHIDVEDMMVSETTRICSIIEEALKNNHGIGHVTLQFEIDKCESKRLI